MGIVEHILKYIKEGIENDLWSHQIILQVNLGHTRCFYLQDVMIYLMGNQFYVPKYKDIHKEILSECHDSLWVGQPE